MTSKYSEGYICTHCGGPRSNASATFCRTCVNIPGHKRWVKESAEKVLSAKMVTTSWRRDTDGVLSRCRGDADVIFAWLLS